MSKTAIKNICVASNYTGSDGKERTTWNILGKVFIGENGKMWGIIDSIPVKWDGKFQLFDHKSNDTAGKSSTSNTIKPKEIEPVDEASELPF